MLLADMLSSYALLTGNEAALNVIVHTCLLPDHKTAFQKAVETDANLCNLVHTIISGCPEDTAGMPHLLHKNWIHQLQCK